MKYLFSVALLISVYGCAAQQQDHANTKSHIKPYTIEGTVLDTDSAKFAYLTTMSQQLPISSDKVFSVVPIVNGKFQFDGTFDLENKKYQHACVFVDIRGNISKEETLSKFRRLIWITGKTKNIRNIVLENLHLEIPGYSNTINAKVTSGGILTKQSDESGTAVREGKLAEFIGKYPDSPISFDQVVTVTALTDESNRDKSASLYGTPEELFKKLSLQQRKSKEGIKLKEKIDAKKY
jgi:hypothetical protein